MEINPFSNIGSVGRTVPARPAPPRPSGEAESSDASDFSGSARLENALRNLPDVRPAAVERGRNVISDTNYPPPETIRKIGRLLALNWDNAQS